MPFSHPKYGGHAIWAYSLILRIDKSKNVIEGLYFIHDHPKAKDALEKYKKLRDQLDSYIATTLFNNWKNEIEAMDTDNIDNKLDVPVLIRSENNQQELPPAISQNALFSRSK